MVETWGYDGELGNGIATNSALPVAVSGLTGGVTAVAGGADHTLAVQNGGIYSWGYNLYGQLGNGTFTSSFVPVAVNGLSSGVTAIAGGTIWDWGLNGYGILGLGDTTAMCVTPQHLLPHSDQINFGI